MYRHIPAVLFLKEQEVVKVQTLKRQTLTPNIPTAVRAWACYVIHKICTGFQNNVTHRSLTLQWASIG